MKKYLGFLIVLSLFILGGSKAQAAINPSTPCDINASPSITVLSPNGGETYLVGQQIEVKWRSCNIPSSAMITPVFSYVDENDVGEVHNGGAQSLNHVLNSGSAWITPPTSFLGTLGKHFKIKLVYNSSYATDPNSIQVLDYSDDTFTITKFENANDFPSGCLSNSGYSTTTGQKCIAQKTSVTVLSPNGGEVYLDGQQIEVKWKTKNVLQDSIASLALQIYDENNNSLGNIGLTTNFSLNDGEETIILPTLAYLKEVNPNLFKNATFGKHFKILIGTGVNGTIQDYSDDFFTINKFENATCSVTSSPSITVLSPNGGETYKEGQQVEVKWKSCNLPRTDTMKVAVGYFGPGSMNPTNTQNTVITTNSNSAIVTMPTLPNVELGLISGNYYKVNVSDTNTAPTVADWSDSLFNLKESTDNSDFKVLSPNGGENYLVGQPINISLNGGLYMTRVGLVYPDFNPYKETNDGNDVHWLSVTSNQGKYFVWDGVTFIDNDGNINPFATGPGQYKIVAIKDVNENKCYLKKISNCVFDLSDSTFSLTNSTPTDQEIRLISPNGGENFIQNIENSITFKYTASTNQFVQIGLVDERATDDSNLVGSPYYIKGWISAPGGPGGVSPFTGRFNWSATQVCDLGFLTCWPVSPGKYKILLQMKDEMGNYSLLPSASNWDVSDRPFTISEQGDIPTNGRITLLSPQSGSRITAGSKVEVRWESSNLPPRSGNTLKMIIKRDGVLVREFRAEDDGSEIVTIPLYTPNGEYQLEYGTISPSSGGGDHYLRYGSATFLVVTPINPIDCKANELYSSTTGQKCFYMNELEKKCDSPAGCIKKEVPMEMKVCDSTAGCYSIPVARVLKIGVKGEDVKYIQTLLGITADGSYGPITASKVKEWQAQKQLKADGIIGPQSISAMSQ